MDTSCPMKMRNFLFLSVILLSAVDSYKILVFSPSVSRSHLLFCGRVADALARGGHEVVLLEPEYNPLASKLNTAEHAKRIIVGNFTNKFGVGIKQFSTSAFEQSGIFTSIRKYVNYVDCFAEACRELMQKEDLIEELKTYKFDMLFIEHTTPCGTGLAHVLGIKTHMWMTSCPLLDHMSWILSVPTPLSYVPTVGEVDVTDRPSYWQRVQNIVTHLIKVYVYRYGSVQINDIFRAKYGEDFPDVDEISRKSPIVFSSADEIVDFPRPGLPNFVRIGGIGMGHQPKSLKEPIKSEMEKGENGVVLISFGSNVKTQFLPTNVKTNILDVTARFSKYHFILRYEEEDKETPALAKNYKNVFVTTWAPQTDILANPRLKAFVTHAGYNSLMETAVAGVPVVTVPFFFDQIRNGRVPERNGWGVFCSKMSLLEGSNELAEALRKVLEDPSYKENALRTAKLVRTQPFSAEEKLLKYTDFVGQNDGRLPELQIAGAELSFIVYFNLDIVVPFVIIVILIAVVIAHFIPFSFKSLFQRKIEQKSSKQKRS